MAGDKLLTGYGIDCIALLWRGENENGRRRHWQRWIKRGSGNDGDPAHSPHRPASIRRGCMLCPIGWGMKEGACRGR